MRTGDADEILCLPRDQEGFLDLSTEPWAETAVVLRGLRFSRLKLKGVEVGSNFVACQFEASVFVEIRSEERFWGADDLWSHCTFRNVNLQGMISPGNKFTDCRFENARLLGFRPFNTVFESCTFENLTLEGYRPEGETLFRRCQFKRPQFSGCWFARTRFEDCVVSEPTVRDCVFTGATASPAPWWSPQDTESDPFLSFLDSVLTLVVKKLGQDHMLVQRVTAFRVAYVAKTVGPDDFAAMFYQHDVPPKDMRRIDSGVDRLFEKHGFH